MRPIISLISGLLLGVSSSSVLAQALPQQPAAPNSHVYFVSPQDGAVINGKVKVIFGLSGMGVAPAGVERPLTGHHHLLINLDELPPLNSPLPATDNLVHFGNGQTETELELPKGKHTLQLLLGDHFHIPHNPPVLSEKITITVK